MKKILIISIGMLMGNCLFAQKISADNIPRDVTSTFKNKYPSAQRVSWQLDYDKYVAEFSSLGSKMSTTFDKEGNWQETDYSIKYSELPKEAKDTISKEFGTILSLYTVEEVVKVESKDKDLFFKAEIIKEGNTYNMMFSENGKTLKKEIIKSDDDDDKVKKNKIDKK